MSNWVLTIQVLLALVATILLIIAFIGLARSEGYGLVTLIFAVIAVVGMLKAPDMIVSFGASRAVAAGVTPVVITAGQQVLDAGQSLLVHGSLGALLVKGIVRGRRACRV